MIQISQVLEVAIRAAERASEEILKVYNSDEFQVEVKGDNSPLTLADKRAHQKILEILEPTGLPILSEEGKNIPYEVRKNWEYFWMVDPLDGTKEFLKRNGEFTVNIALIEKQTPVLGVVGVPVAGELFYGAKGVGAFVKRGEKIEPLHQRKPIDLSKPGLRVVASRSHMNEETLAYIDKLKNTQLVSKGSSLKFMLLAEGKADVYPRFAPTMEWDTAAAHAVLSALHISVLQKQTNQSLVYNKPDLLNPHFISF